MKSIHNVSCLVIFLYLIFAVLLANLIVS